jgi:deoxyribodipyrimidine photo-lyase
MERLLVGKDSEGAVPVVPAIRIRQQNQQQIRAGGDYVLYWMIASRRVHFNFALDRALEYCDSLQKPLLIFEALRVNYRWASDRMHRFVLDGMRDNARECEAAKIRYFPYVEPESGAGKGLLAALAETACVIVTDEFPCFFLPRMVTTAAQKVPVLLESVDSNGLLPLYATEQVALRAFDFRRYLQKELPKHLSAFPRANPLAKSKFAAGATIAPSVLKRWPSASQKMLAGERDSLSSLPIDHSVAPASLQGGHSNARLRMNEFLHSKLPLYAEDRNEPELDATSGFSPFLHFGHLSVHEVFVELARREKWKPEKLGLRTNGSRDGFWNMSPSADSFLDELITWREVGYNFAAHRGDYDKYESLPDWVKGTLAEHAADERDHLYSLQEFETARTHDALWNAAQQQLVQEGRIHNYLRMLWGKKILQWTRTPQEAAEIMIHLNNKYGLDGRDPNSYSGIFWVLGRYDRPWAPERPVFGMIRYMSSENTARKFPVKKYLQKYAPELVAQQSLLDIGPADADKMSGRTGKRTARA